MVAKNTELNINMKSTSVQLMKSSSAPEEYQRNRPAFRRQFQQSEHKSTTSNSVNQSILKFHQKYNAQISTNFNIKMKHRAYDLKTGTAGPVASPKMIPHMEEKLYPVKKIKAKLKMEIKRSLANFGRVLIQKAILNPAASEWKPSSDFNAQSSSPELVKNQIMQSMSDSNAYSY